jgi:hypothetical protein
MKPKIRHLKQNNPTKTLARLRFENYDEWFEFINQNIAKILGYNSNTERTSLPKIILPISDILPVWKSSCSFLKYFLCSPTRITPNFIKNPPGIWKTMKKPREISAFTNGPIFLGLYYLKPEPPFFTLLRQMKA